MNDDLVIITGVGRRSEIPGLPIIRQTILHVLEKELRLPVKFGSSEGGRTARPVPQQQTSNEHHGPERGFEAEHHPTEDANCAPEGNVAPETAFRASDNGKPTRAKGRSTTDALVARKPTNFGRLIVAKDALEEWLSRKHRVLLSRSRVKACEEEVAS